jgi:hypothetical protein
MIYGAFIPEDAPMVPLTGGIAEFPPDIKRMLHKNKGDGK